MENRKQAYCFVLLSALHGPAFVLGIWRQRCSEL